MSKRKTGSGMHHKDDELELFLKESEDQRAKQPRYAIPPAPIAAANYSVRPQFYPNLDKFLAEAPKRQPPAMTQSTGFAHHPPALKRTLQTSSLDEFLGQQNLSAPSQQPPSYAAPQLFQDSSFSISKAFSLADSSSKTLSRRIAYDSRFTTQLLSDPQWQNLFTNFPPYQQSQLHIDKRLNDCPTDMDKKAKTRVLLEKLAEKYAADGINLTALQLGELLMKKAHTAVVSVFNHIDKMYDDIKFKDILLEMNQAGLSWDHIFSVLSPLHGYNSPSMSIVKGNFLKHKFSAIIEKIGADNFALFVKDLHYSDLFKIVDALYDRPDLLANLQSLVVTLDPQQQKNFFAGSRVAGKGFNCEMQIDQLEFLLSPAGNEHLNNITNFEEQQKTGFNLMQLNNEEKLKRAVEKYRRRKFRAQAQMIAENPPAVLADPQFFLDREEQTISAGAAYGGPAFEGSAAQDDDVFAYLPHPNYVQTETQVGLTSIPEFDWLEDPFKDFPNLQQQSTDISQPEPESQTQLREGSKKISQDFHYNFWNRK